MSVINICEEVLISLLWVALNVLNKVAYQNSLQCDWQIVNNILTGQSWRKLKSCSTGGGTEQGFLCCFTDVTNWD